MPRTPYPIDRDSLRKAVPPGHEPPPLLLAFAEWLDGCPWGSVGGFRVEGTFSDDAPIVDGPPLRRDFSLFLSLPDGSVVGLYHPDGDDPATSPVVGLGSEGQATVLASTLEGFLAKLALAAFADSDWSDLAPWEDEDGEEEASAPAEDGPAALHDWLAARIGSERVEALAAERPDSASFAARMEAWTNERETFWAGHPTLRAIARHLAAHRPPGPEPWNHRSFRVAIVGSLSEARVLMRGPQPFPEAAAIEPLLRDLRDAQARTDPALGLWFSADLSLFGDGRILPRFDYQARPTIGGAPAPLGEARADLARAPRPDRWVPA